MPFNPKNIHSIEYVYDTTRSYIMWKEGVAHRYHVHLNNRPEDGDFTIYGYLYKNPIAKYNEPGYFNTRSLDPDAKKNLEMINYVIGVCKANALNVFARHAYRDKKAAEAADRAERATKIEHAKQIFKSMRELAIVNAGRADNFTYELTFDDVQALLMFASNEETNR